MRLNRSSIQVRSSTRVRSSTQVRSPEVISFRMSLILSIPLQKVGAKSNSYRVDIHFNVAGGKKTFATIFGKAKARIDEYNAR